MSDFLFEKAYKSLNPSQKEAVDTIEGPVMVIAGPGTGKTSILTLRIANILRKTDTPPDGILALTFTESGVHSMRRKLVELIGPAAYRVHIFTFHGFAEEVRSRFPEYFPRIIGGMVIDDSEKYEILEKALLSGEYDIIRPFGKPTMYVRIALKAIGDLKREGISPKEFVKILEKEEKSIMKSPDLVHQKGRFKGEMKSEYKEALRNNKKNRELAELYAEYEDALKEGNFYDYDDMLLELVGSLKKHSDLLRVLQEEYLYILADEHQDANNSQNAILEMLSDYENTSNIFIVGDEKQAIYRFQGASLENFLYFQKKYPDARLIYLEDNYRSTQTILDTSYKLMERREDSESPLRPRLKSASKEGLSENKIRLISFSTEEAEVEGVAKDISERIAEGLSPEDTAILVRTNSEIAEIGRALERFGVPFALFTDDNVLEDSDISKLLLLLRAIVNPENDEYAGSLLFIDFLGLYPLDALKLNRLAAEKRLSPLEVLGKERSWPELGDADAARKLSKQIVRWIVLAKNEGAIESFTTITEESGFTEYLLGKKESLEKVEKLSKLFDYVKTHIALRKNSKLGDFLSALDILLRHGGSISFSKRSLGGRGVSVMTAHKSKGLEWRNVYILNVADRVWGNRRVPGGFRLPDILSAEADSERNDDEKRLFYVALTRAKESITLSYSQIDDNGKDTLVSQFVEELPKEMLDMQEGSQTDMAEKVGRIFSKREDKTRTIFDTEYLREIFIDQGLNATALNNYVECPWKYFFKNLVRLPEIQAPYLHYGNAVHCALRALAEARREGRGFGKDDFLRIFEQDLSKCPLSEKDLEILLKRGQDNLSLYYERREADWHNNSLTEYNIAGVFVPFNGGNLLLRGRLDKLEILGGSEVNVVDYKTGQSKSRNEILGNTKNSHGSIKRQLNFYRLLLELHDDGKFEMARGTIDFIEPDEKGKFRQEQFEMSAIDAESVREEIVSAANDIYSFSFWEKSCSDKECEYCNLRKTLFTS